MFYAPWCGHCKAMKPDYALAAKEAKEKNYTAVLAALDATIHTVTASSSQIKGYPTRESTFETKQHSKNLKIIFPILC